MKVIGILGGMGPQATVDLYQKIINNTPATKDQEHLQVLIWSDPTIPDRTAAILEGGEDPFPHLWAGVDKLVAGKADCIAIPCNTAHYFLPRLAALAPTVTCLNMIELTAERLKKDYSPGSTIAVTGTTATLKTGLYQRALKQAGLVPLLPDEDLQNEVMDIIFGTRGVKAGFVDQVNKNRYAKVLSSLQAQGAACVIAGCTELPLIVDRAEIAVVIVDPTEVLAQRAVQFALKN